MARIRSIKPEFWSSEQIMDLSPMARLLFIGLWNFCDDGGNHPASAKTLKAEVFPSDDITSASVQLLVDELSSNSLITLYFSGGKEFWHVNGWKHQKIDKPTYKHPPYIEEESEATRRGLVEASPPEGKGREGKGSKPLSPNSSVSDGSNPHGEKPKDATRAGTLCKRLRLIGINAAPHLLQHPDWIAMLAIRSDDDVIAVAEIAKAKRPGENLSLNYLLPMLRDQAPASLTGGQSHATRQGSVAATVAAFTGRASPDSGDGGGEETVIEGCATRVHETG
jgi:hypothetical protein